MGWSQVKTYLIARDIFSYVMVVLLFLFPQSFATLSDFTMRNTPSERFSHLIMEGQVSEFSSRSRMNSQSFPLPLLPATTTYVDRSFYVTASTV